MKVTNSFGLPAVLVKACENQRKPKENSLSCTELIDSPLIHRLKLEHWEQLEVDVSEMVWAMTGTALHQMIEKHGAATSEIALEADFEGFKITGTCDHLTPELISDWKTTSVWSVMIGSDWLNKVEQQLNIYRYLNWRMTGQLVPRVSACVIFRDWRRSEYKRNPNEYPSRNVIEYNLRCWEITETESFIRNRLEIHQDKNYLCSMEDRWAKPDVYAVKKTGAVRATKLFDNQFDAIEMVHKNKGMEIEHRMGSHTRCQEYCPVRDVCRYKVITNELEL
jgi:hypothetical protein